MTWKTVLKEEKFKLDMDGHNHIDVLMELSTAMNKLAAKAESDIIKVFEEIKANSEKSGAGTPKGLAKTNELLVNLMDDFIENTEKGVKSMMGALNDKLEENFVLFSPSTEGEMEHDENTDRQQDAYREQMAESYYSQEYEQDRYYD